MKVQAMICFVGAFIGLLIGISSGSINKEFVSQKATVNTGGEVVILGQVLRYEVIWIADQEFIAYVQPGSSKIFLVPTQCNRSTSNYD